MAPTHEHVLDNVDDDLDRHDAATVDGASRHWTFLSNHAHVLVCLATDPDARLRDVAVKVGITERAVLKIVSDLEHGGVIARARDGRRNHYRLFLDRPLRHPLESHRTVAALVSMVLSPAVLQRLADDAAAGTD